MKNETPLYLDIYQDLVNKMDYGALREGDRFPSYRTLCQYYHVSLFPVRAAVKKLVEEGYIRSAERSPSVVTYDPAKSGGKYRRLSKKDMLIVEETYIAQDILIFPLMRHSLRLCEEAEWEALSASVRRMKKNVGYLIEYWGFAFEFWRTVLQKGNNSFFLPLLHNICYCRESLLLGRAFRLYEIEMYQKLTKMLRAGKDPDAVFSKLTMRRLFVEQLLHANWQAAPEETGPPYYRKLPPSGSDYPTLYAAIVMDLLQKIQIGQYQRGAYLPTHAELCTAYQVSNITISRVMQELKHLGFVESKRGKRGGMRLLAGPEEIRKLAFQMEENQKRARRYLDCLQALSLTIEAVALHAAPAASLTDGVELQRDVASRTEGGTAFHPALPLLFNFVLTHIRNGVLRDGFNLLAREFFSNDVFCLSQECDAEKSGELSRLCAAAAGALIQEDYPLFSRCTRDAFTYFYHWVLESYMAAQPARQGSIAGV